MNKGDQAITVIFSNHKKNYFILQEMASIMEYFKNNYNEIFELRETPGVETWPLMSSPVPTIIIVMVYLIFVLSAGPRVMEKRPAYELQTALILYNAFQVFFSIWLTIVTFKIDIIGLIFTDTCSTERVVHVDEKIQYTVALVGWWYYLAKMTELLDTVFFILRKKFNQVSFLHIYHHASMAFFSWYYVKFFPAEQGIFIGFLNSSVHVVMYSYYLIAALGPKYKKYLWWKKYMTQMQLVQFMLVLAYLSCALAVDCRMSKALTYFFISDVTIFLCLFANYYRNAYKSKKD